MTTANIPERRTSSAAKRNAISPYISRDRPRKRLVLRLSKDLDPKRRKFFAPDTPEGLAALERKRDALFAELDADATARELRARPGANVTFGDVQKDYIASKPVKQPKEREQLLDKWAKDLLAHRPIAALGHRDVQDVLDGVAAKGRSETTGQHVKDAVYKVFEFAYLRDQVPTLEFFLKVRMPAFEQREDLTRTLVTDAEIDKLVTCAEVPLYWRCKAAVSRGLGGCRVSDAHAIRWERLVNDFNAVIVPRPKTRKSKKKAERRLHKVPAGVRRLLLELHMEQGRPAEGFVFGEGRRHMGSARALRTWLWNAGVRRHEVHNDRPGVSRRTDWHSLRRKYATRVAETADKRTSMLASGHSSESVNELYLFDRDLIEIPEEALPPALRAAE